jgi:PAS domain S-box-containing protein
MPTRRLTHDGRILLLALTAGFPAVLVSLVLVWTGEFTSKVEWTLTVVVVGFWLGCSFALQSWVVLPLQTISNLLAALREGDYSIRARGARMDDALGQVLVEANTLSQTLQEQRRGAVEADALLRTVMVEIDVAIFTFDGEQRLRLANRAGERLLRQSAEELLGRPAADLGLAECLEGETPRTIQITLPGGAGRWEVRRSTFRAHGLPHQLLLLADLSRVLREEEQFAWRRLVRVLGHELNNSLAPIKSIAGSLERLLRRNPLPSDWQEDMERGLGVIVTRADALGRFMSAYARLARLPPPELAALDVGPWIRRVVALETRLPIALEPGPEATIRADAGQLEQVLINLLRNAVDAALETGGGVALGWDVTPDHLDVWIDDEGLGLSNTTNLFVPFFTTKPGGSGIGLVLSRQIVENHGGTLTLENRESGRGCQARLRLPA